MEEYLKEKLKPGKLISVYCLKCKDLLIKIYPWCPNINWSPNDFTKEAPLCKKCLFKKFKQ